METKPTTPPAPVATSKKEEAVVVPKEFFSANRAIRVMIAGDQFTLDFDPMIAQEIGAYTRCKIRVMFKEGQGVQILPIMPN